MKRKSVITGLLIMASAGVFTISCSRSSAPSSGSASELKYRFAGDVEYSYSTVSHMAQLLEFMGQEISAVIDNNVSYTVARVDENDGIMNLKVTMGEVSARASSAQGEMSSDSPELKGKSFNMQLSANGIESGLEEAEKISYKTVGDQQSNLKATFSMMFPDLPEGPVSTGYTWTDSDTIDLSVEGQSILMIINSNNIIEGMEEIDGMNCYRIAYTNTGERTASGNMGGGYMTSSGDITGSGVLYFAPAEGVVVKDNSTQKFSGEITIPTGESLPMFMDITIVTTLAGR